MRLLVTILLLSHASVSSAQTLDEARRAYLEADFRRSAETFEAVLETPSVDRAGAVEAHRHLAALRLLLGDAALARRHAEAAVALDPATSPPEGAPPAAESLFDEARDAFGGRAAAIAIEGETAGDDLDVRASVSPAPEALADRIGLRCVHGADAAEETAELPEVALRIARPAQTVHCRAWITGGGGAQLIDASATFDLEAASEQVTEVGEGGSPWPWIGLVAGVLVVGAVVAYALISSGSDGARLGAPQAEGW